MTEAAEARPPPLDGASRFRRLCRWLEAKPIEVIGAFIAFLAAGAALAGIFLVWWQLVDLRETLASTAHSYISDELFQLDKTLVEADLYPYFEKGEDLQATDSAQKRNQVLAYAETKLDFIENFLSQRQHLADVDWGAWADYFVRSFEESPILCATVSDKPSEFDKGVVDIAKIVCPNFTGSMPASVAHSDAVRKVVKVINPGAK